MRALTYHGIRDVRVDACPDPALVSPTDAIVAVRFGAICGSDLHVWHGRETGLDPGTVMGHEFLGEIVDAGPGVTRWQRGDLVVSPFTTSCGVCFFCSHDLPARCETGQLFGWVERGHGLHGGQAELVRVPLADSTLVRVPADLLPEVALLLGDVLATGYHCATLAEVAPGKSAAVIGCGPVGLMAVLAARELGAESVFAIDTVPERLALAARFGATPVALDDRVVGTIRDATDGRGVDAALEAVGSPAAGRLAFDVVRPGGSIGVVGVHHEANFPFSPGAAYDKNLTWRIGRCPARKYMETLVPLARRRQDDLARLFTHRLPLADAAGGYEVFDARRDGCIKVLLTP
jgi:threonine dehydrogenase-like Zn-dependent dehydrogenase